MKVLITGGSGQLAGCIRQEWTTKVGEELFFATSKDLDFYNPSAVRSYLKEHSITDIVHTSAYTAVDKAEDEPEIAERVNVDQVRSISKAVQGLNIDVIHISTDFVYGSTSYFTPRRESEEVKPESVYGRTKLASEEVLRESGVPHLILRTSWLYSKIGHNFLNTMTRLFSEGKDLKVVNDQHGTPTSAYSLARFIRDLLRSPDHLGLTYGTVLNFSNEGEATWYDFAKEIKESQNLPGTIQPCTSEEYPQKAKRPNYSVMDLTKLRGTGWENMSWEQALEEVTSN